MVLDDVDYCVVLTTEEEDMHLRQHFDTIISFFGRVGSNTHVIDKSCNQERDEYLAGLGIQTHRIDRFVQLGRDGLPVSSGYGFDVARGYEYAVERCGSLPNCVVSHPDIIYKSASLLSELCGELVKPGVGVVGACTSVIGVKREAYSQSPIKFTPMLGLAVADRNEQVDSCMITWSGDTRPHGRMRPVLGPDVGELMIAMIGLLGWVYVPFNPGWVDYMHHTGGGSGYWVTDEGSKKSFENKRSVAIVEHWRAMNRLT